MSDGITHSTVVDVPDDGTSPVGTDEWNAAHDITGDVDARGYRVTNLGAPSDPEDAARLADVVSGAVNWLGDWDSDADYVQGDGVAVARAVVESGALDIPGTLDVQPGGSNDMARFWGEAGDVVRITVSTTIPTGTGVVLADGSNRDNHVFQFTSTAPGTYETTLGLSGDHWLYGYPPDGALTGAGTWALIRSANYVASGPSSNVDPTTDDGSHWVRLAAAAGPAGPAGPAGTLPAGGMAGQALVKRTVTEDDLLWASVTTPGDGIIDGGEVTGPGGMVVHVSAVRGRLGGVEGRFITNTLAVTAADPTHDRIDVVYFISPAPWIGSLAAPQPPGFDTSQNDGIPAASPVAPGRGPGGALVAVGQDGGGYFAALASYRVPAGATSSEQFTDWTDLRSIVMPYGPQADYVPDGSTVDELRDALIAAGLMASP